WAEFGPFDLQPDRPLLYLVYFFAGVGIGVQGYDRGLLRAGGPLARRWYLWIGAAAISFLLWMASMAPAAYGRSNVFINLCAYLAVVLVVATVCLGLLGLFLRYSAWRLTLVESLSEHAFGIYLVLYVIVYWLQYALLGAAIPAIVKGLTVFAGALLLSWGVAVGAGQLTFLALPIRAAASKS